MNSILIYLFSIPILVLVVILFFLVSLLFVNRLAGVRCLPTSQRAIKTILRIIDDKKSNGTIFYDLGCGTGEVVISVKKNFPELSVFAIENIWSQIFFAKLKSYFLRKKIIFLRKDLFKENLQKANIVYCYLPRNLIPDLEKKLKKELRPNTIIITNTVSFPNWQPIETHITYPKKPDFEKIFVYIKDEKSVV